MDIRLKIVLAVILLSMVFSREKIGNYLGFGPVKERSSRIAEESKNQSLEEKEAENSDYFVDDAVYYWDEQLLDWISVDEQSEYQKQLVTYNELSAVEPIEITWKVLMDINYRLRYFSEVEMELYSPIFPEAVQALDGKEVIIEGYVIPFDEEEELLSLSYNPYASCFFCGKASPASVISMYLKNNRKRYKMDDFKKFKGTLYLNHDDPNEFYYILRDAEEG